ncbi:MAG: FKBP-type peptidyl-prolyl cis-trans isomerase [Balneolaceae bacterium]|nr:FKBP-type peptidyl-prolyl cis-trans isomerase [Balneolaceae bacterium]
MFSQRLTLFCLLATFTLLASCNSNSGSMSSGSANLETNIDSVSYSLGYQNGMVLNQQGMTDIDLDLLAKGIQAGMDDSLESQVPESDMRSIIQEYQMSKRQQTMQQQQEQAQVNNKKGQQFLAENIKNEGVQETESGLQYEVLEEGDGASPTAKDTVTVHYRGTLLDGTQFDSSYERGEPATFPLNQVIPGWTEGVQLMQEGAKYKFWIPSELAYGNNPRPGGPIKPGSTLIFEVELLEVN